METYLDHSATTYVDKRVKKEMDRYFSKFYGNPGSLNTPGLEAKKSVDDARERISKILNCKPNEIIFCSGGTESDNLAIRGVVRANKGKHIITSKIEHKAILETCKYLEENGYDVDYLNVNKKGFVDLNELKNKIRKDTVLVSIMYANNEVGTIQDIEEIGKICKEKGVLFHTDACQAANYLDLNVKDVDLMTLNGSKIYGPKGIGILYKREEVKIKPIIFGGGQEFTLRSGTENVPGIIGFAKALELVQEDRDVESKRLIELRNKLIDGLLNIKGVRLNGDKEKRLPNNVNISIDKIEGESLLMRLDKEKIYASTGSACTSKTLDASHVLLAMGIPEEVAHGSLRFTIGRKTREKHINKVLSVIPTIVKNLREISSV
jgi:cysteine desulfurase